VGLVIELLPDDDQLAIVEAARLATTSIGDRSGSSLTTAEWAALGDVGLFGLGVPEEGGGAGSGGAAEVLVAEVLGAALAPLSIVGSMVTARALHAAGSRRLQDVLSGTARVALAIEVPGGGRWHVIDLPKATLVAVVSGDSMGLADASTLRGVVHHTSIDPGVDLSECDVPTSKFVVERAAPLGRHAALLLAAMGVGVSGRAVEAAAAYAKERRQFNRPIGAFQAVKHRCVDMLIRHEAACASVRFAAIRADVGIYDEMIDVAVLTASCAARENAASAIQVFGGIGFTAEAGVDRLLRRGWLLERASGPSAARADALVSQASRPR
jgi:alkylation response protein AidB-like acyl-CoA dehydrogenase